MRPLLPRTYCLGKVKRNQHECVAMKVVAIPKGELVLQRALVYFLDIPGSSLQVSLRLCQYQATKHSCGIVTSSYLFLCVLHEVHSILLIDGTVYKTNPSLFDMGTMGVAHSLYSNLLRTPVSTRRFNSLSTLGCSAKGTARALQKFGVADSLTLILALISSRVPG